MNKPDRRRRSAARSTGPTRATMSACSCGTSAADPSGPAGTHPVRARLVDGVDSRPSTCRCRAAPIPRRWIISPRAASTPGASTWRATAAPPRPATTTRRSPTAPTTASPPRPISRSCAASKPLLVYGISSGALRAALFAQRHPEMVQRLALDAHVWTGEGSPTLAERSKRLPEFRAKNRRPIDRAFVHSIFDARPSRHRRRQRDRGVRRRDPQARRFGADRHLCRHVLEPAGLRSGEDHGADHHHARAVGRHRELRGPDEVLREAAQSRTSSSR